MNAIRIYKRLDSVIPQLPELTPLVGREVEIIASERGETRANGTAGVRKTPGVSGGRACAGNTRIPVWTLIQLKRLGRTEEQLLEDYPSLLKADLDAVWDYYRSHLSEIEADIADQANEDSDTDYAALAVRIDDAGRSLPTVMGQMVRVVKPPP